MKKIAKILIFSLIFVFLTGIFASCGNKSGTQISENDFKDSVNVSEENLTLTLEYSYDGEEMTATIKVVDGKTYYMSEFDFYWYEGVGDQFLNILAQLADNYSQLSFADGVYSADSFTYTEEGYEYEIVNVALSFDSDGRLSKLYYEEEEIDGNRIYRFTLSDYGSTNAPDEEDIVRDDGGVTEGPSNNMDPGHQENAGEGGANPEGDDGSNPDDPGKEAQTALTEEEWKAAFELEDDNFTALLNMYSPGSVQEYEYRVLEGIAYYSDPHNVNWASGSTENLTEKVMPFANLYSEFEFDGRTYFCSVSSLDYGEGISVIDVYVRFDEQKRLTHLSYTLAIGDENGSMVIDLYGYGETVAPDPSTNSGNTSVENNKVQDGSMPEGGNASEDSGGFFTGDGDSDDTGSYSDSAEMGNVSVSDKVTVEVGESDDGN